MRLKLSDGKLEIEAESHYIKFKADKNLKESIIYLPEKRMEFLIPEGERLDTYPAGTFAGPDYSFSCVEASAEEIIEYRNLALNPADRRFQTEYFPHSDANFVTKDKFCLESRNAIDGFTKTKGHGNYPYTSWGGGLRDDLEFSLEFGRSVAADKIVLYLRADFFIYKDGKEHDAYWKDVTVKFSDGTDMEIHPVKSAEGQGFSFPQKTVTGLKLVNLVRDLSYPVCGYAALTQIEVYGKDI